MDYDEEFFISLEINFTTIQPATFCGLKVLYGQMVHYTMQNEYEAVIRGHLNAYKGKVKMQTDSFF